MLLQISLLALFATSALADGAAILAAINKISADNTALNNAVQGWGGDLLGALPISDDSDALLSAINDATSVAKASQPLSDTEALAIAQATQQLQSGTATTLSTIEAAKSKFSKLSLDSTILADLQKQKSATDSFGAAVVAKIPTALQSDATTLVSQIDALFNTAISDFSS